MKLLHLSDLHLGKRVNEFSLLEDQKYILTKIINLIDEYSPQVILIAGDIYDKTVPPAEAVELFDDFLYRLWKRNLKVLIISGNHDSSERIAFGGRLMKGSGIYLSPVYQGKVEPVVLEDEYGEISFYLLPFLKPANVRRYFPEEEITTYHEAIKKVVEEMNIDCTKRNVLLTHQFVTGGVPSESEEITVGGTDHVEVEIFQQFDYVALGHLHRPQKCREEWIRYSGTPLKYSFSEAKDEKTVTLVELGKKGDYHIEQVPLIPRRDMVELKGTYEELTRKSFYENTGYQEDYVHITLTDEEDIPEVLMKLRVIYKNLMKLDYDNLRTKHQAPMEAAKQVTQKTPIEHFDTFYELQNGQPLSEEQKHFLSEITEQIWRKEE